MSVGALRRRLARLDAGVSAPPCPGDCGRMHFQIYDEYDRCINPLPERCPICGGEFSFQYHVRPAQPLPLSPDAPPVAPRSSVGGIWGNEGCIGGRPPGPPDGPTGARRGD